MLEDGVIEDVRRDRYAGWSGELGSSIMDGSSSLSALRERALGLDAEPQPASGRQEMLENAVATYIERVR